MSLNDKNGSITIVDLSLLPAEVTHIITSVMARVTLEALQRYRRQNIGETLPTVLVMEEAHTFIKRYNADTENENATAMCTKVFEKLPEKDESMDWDLSFPPNAQVSCLQPSSLNVTVSSCIGFQMTEIRNW